MIKIINSLILILLGFNFVMGQKTDWERMNLKGNVKQLEESFSNTDLNSSFSITSFFDSKGNIVKIEIVSKFENIENKDLLEYQYEAGKLVEIRNYINQNLLQKTNFTYDAKGNKIEEITYSKSNVFLNKIEFVYDEKDNIIESKTYHLNKNFLTQHITFKYDDQNQLIEQLTNSSDTFIFKETYQYNEFGDKVEVVFTENDISSTTLYEYKYDQQRNWIEKSEYKNRQLTEVRKRTITYY